MKTRKNYRVEYTGVSASDTYVIVDNGSQNLVGTPIEDIVSTGSFETITKDLTTTNTAEIAPSKRKTIVNATIDDKSVIEADVSNLMIGDLVFIRVNNTAGLIHQIEFATNFDVHSYGAFDVPDGSYILFDFIFDGTNLVLTMMSKEVDFNA